MFRLEFETDNAAFDDAAAEANHILQEIAGCLRAGYPEGIVRDRNGNRIGTYELKEGA